MYTRSYLCLRLLTMFTPVYFCLFMFTRVYLFATVYLCLSMFTTVHSCMLTKVDPCIGVCLCLPCLLVQDYLWLLIYNRFYLC